MQRGSTRRESSRCSVRPVAGLHEVSAAAENPSRRNGARAVHAGAFPELLFSCAYRITMASAHRRHPASSRMVRTARSRPGARARSSRSEAREKRIDVRCRRPPACRKGDRCASAAASSPAVRAYTRAGAGTNGSRCLCPLARKRADDRAAGGRRRGRGGLAAARREWRSERSETLDYPRDNQNGVGRGGISHAGRRRRQRGKINLHTYLGRPSARPGSRIGSAAFDLSNETGAGGFSRFSFVAFMPIIGR